MREFPRRNIIDNRSRRGRTVSCWLASPPPPCAPNPIAASGVLLPRPRPRRDAANPAGTARFEFQDLAEETPFPEVRSRPRPSAPGPLSLLPGIRTVQEPQGKPGPAGGIQVPRTRPGPPVLAVPGFPTPGRPGALRVGRRLRGLTCAGGSAPRDREWRLCAPAGSGLVLAGAASALAVGCGAADWLGVRESGARRARRVFNTCLPLRRLLTAPHTPPLP